DAWRRRSTPLSLCDTALRPVRSRLRLDFFVCSASPSPCSSGIDPSRDRRKYLRRPLLLESPHPAHVGGLELPGKFGKHAAPIDPAAWPAADHFRAAAATADQRTQ